MQILLLLMFIAPLIVLGYVMSKLDLYFNREQAPNPPLNRAALSVLVYGNTPLAKKLTDACRKHGYRTIFTESPNPPQETIPVDMVFACSTDDLENLMLCRLCEHHFGTKKTFGYCNHSLYGSIYKDVCFAYTTDVNSDPSILFEQLEVKEHEKK